VSVASSQRTVAVGDVGSDQVNSLKRQDFLPDLERFSVLERRYQDRNRDSKRGKAVVDC
jgi:hypothetical protein